MVSGWISVWHNGSAEKVAGLSSLQWLGGVLVLVVSDLIFPSLSAGARMAQRLRGESEEVLDSDALAEERGEEESGHWGRPTVQA